jgi:hypothetical protein
VTRNAPITAAIAPLAPRFGTVECADRRDLGKHGHQPANQVENQIPPSPHRIFDLGAKAHKKIMLPMMCDQLACMNIAVRIVIHPWPEKIWAGIADHVRHECFAAHQLRTKTNAFMRMMRIVTTGTRD